MIDPKSLRIGNYIMNYSALSVVEGVYWDNPYQEHRAMVKNVERGNYAQPFAKDMSGITLTEEWLIRLGFSRLYNYGPIPQPVAFSLLGYFHIFENMNNWSLMIVDKTIKSDINYVHQLQNIFYVLTNEELIIKGEG
jgi:hypothetical protein